MQNAQALQWQRSWDLQQESFRPDREECFTALLDVAEAVGGDAPRVLDLACGTGSITQRLLHRMPDASSLGVDFDPVMLAIAEGTFAGDHRARFVRADLMSPDWRDGIEGPFDAVLSATALHWLPEQRLRALYGEVRELLVDGGVFSNSDHMVDPALPDLTPRLEKVRERKQDEVYRSGRAMTWSAWWEAARAAPELADAVAERDRAIGNTGGDHGDSLPQLPAHLDALRHAGFAEVGLVWRGLTDAAFAAVR